MGCWVWPTSVAITLSTPTDESKASWVLFHSALLVPYYSWVAVTRFTTPIATI
ncbi:MAG: hypothetical protein CM15mP77_4290 [Synechococcus sp.]|nr:MAG: hypothetical protein CM15mP77_4290 [Synechococcus sp.]